MTVYKPGTMIEPSIPFLLEIAAGRVEGCTAHILNGSNNAVGTGFETLWEEGGLYSFPTSASTMTVSSDDAADTSAGTGARTVTISGLDANYAEITEVITMNGTTAVTTTNSYFRINNMVVTTAGTGRTNAGSIFIGTGTVTAGKPANVYAEIFDGDGIEHEGVYTVPAGKSLYPYTMHFGAQSGKDVVLQAHSSSEAGVDIVYAEWEVSDHVTIPVDGLFRIPEKTDFEFRAKVSSGTSDMKILMLSILRDEE